MKHILILPLILAITLIAACDRTPQEVIVSDVYTFETPENFPVAAAFMTIENNTDLDDRMVGFQTNMGRMAELHTMVMEGDIMRMRGVEAYDVASGQTHMLEPGGDHVMIMNVQGNPVAGEEYEGMAIFEQAGEIPVTITVRSRKQGE
jgi:copper(I)-binding protein